MKKAEFIPLNKKNAESDHINSKRQNLFRNELCRIAKSFPQP